MPKDANPNGDIFGGWVISQMDIAAGMTATQRSLGRAATVAIDGMVFKLPVYVGDVLCVYTDLSRVGTSSMTIQVEAWALRRSNRETVKVTRQSSRSSRSMKSGNRDRCRRRRPRRDRDTNRRCRRRSHQDSLPEGSDFPSLEKCS